MGGVIVFFYAVAFFTLVRGKGAKDRNTAEAYLGVSFFCFLAGLLFSILLAFNSF